MRGNNGPYDEPVVLSGRSDLIVDLGLKKGMNGILGHDSAVRLYLAGDNRGE